MPNLIVVHVGYTREHDMRTWRVFFNDSTSLREYREGLWSKWFTVDSFEESIEHDNDTYVFVVRDNGRAARVVWSDDWEYSALVLDEAEENLVVDTTDELIQEYKLNTGELNAKLNAFIFRAVQSQRRAWCVVM